MATKHIRVLLTFTRQSDHQIVEIAGAVITGMTGNKNFPDPPVDLAEVSWLRFCASSPLTFRATATTISPRFGERTASGLTGFVELQRRS